MQGTEKVVILASADAALRKALCTSFESMRWQVKEAAGGASAMTQLEEHHPEALLLDSWLPDLEVGALAEVMHQLYPEVSLFRLDGTSLGAPGKSLWRNEILHALREVASSSSASDVFVPGKLLEVTSAYISPSASSLEAVSGTVASVAETPGEENRPPEIVSLLPELIGASAPMRELARLVRLVAPHPARVLIEGETGSGKELVARAVHTLSGREAQPFVALNCAAIPEALLEAELFGHTRGAFTGAVQARVGRIEAADGGTLFLDEIGELPLALQAKLLRFLENGELQRVGGNETVRVNVRVVSATHQFLEQRAEAGTFRLDLYHRLATFPVLVPSLRERLEDLPMLAEYLLTQLCRNAPKKKLGACALERLGEHPWPGNVRELQNVLQRALILSEQRPELLRADVVFGHGRRN